MKNIFTPTLNSVVVPSDRATDRHDTLTVSAIAIIVFALSSVLHEGIGHGGACLINNGTAVEISSMTFDCSLSLDTTAHRWVAAGGTIASLISGAMALALYHLKGLSGGARYGLWLFAAVNLMQVTGYLLFSGMSNVGDWAVVIEGRQPHWLWRVVLIAGGLSLYLGVTKHVFNILDPLLGEARPRRFEHGMRLGGRAYIAGGTLAILAGVLHPGGIEVVLLSGAAATLGGASGLAWGPNLLRGTRTPSSLLEKPVVLVRRSWLTVVAAVIIGLAFIIVLGPGWPL